MVKVTSVEQALKGTLSKGRTAPKAGSKKTPSFYPADDAKFPLKRAAVAKTQTKLRASITPGTILILLAGHFKGKRVIFLKQLESGLLLVCGPYGVNGVPAKRVNQCYVIATSQKVDVSGVDCGKFDDKYFKKPAKDRSKKSEEDFFKEERKRRSSPRATSRTTRLSTPPSPPRCRRCLTSPATSPRSSRFAPATNPTR